MKQKFTLEISVETLEGALAAERGGADRIELCGDLSVGGVTPGVDLVRTVRAQIRIPLFMMIRPRAGDFVFTEREFEMMKRSMVEAKKSGADGVVLGILNKDRRVDIERTRELVNLARPLPVTYHRAFDETADLHGALEDVIQTGSTRILTSGGAAGAPAGAATLAELVRDARGRIIIVPGAGIHASNILQIAQRTQAREFHSGLSTALPYGSREYKKFEEEVRRLAERIVQMSRT